MVKRETLILSTLKILGLLVMCARSRLMSVIPEHRIRFAHLFEQLGVAALVRVMLDRRGAKRLLDLCACGGGDGGSG